MINIAHAVIWLVTALHENQKFDNHCSTYIFGDVNIAFGFNALETSLVALNIKYKCRYKVFS